MKRQQKSVSPIVESGKNKSNRYDGTNSHPPDALKFELRSQFQRDVIKSIHRNHVTAMIGAAGSAKTLLAAYGGMQLMHKHEVKKIAVVRIARESYYENIGALPGDTNSKLSYISAPIFDNLELMMPRMDIEKWVDQKQLEILPVSHLRGRSLHDCYLIVEEAQNLPREVILTTLTRIAAGSKIVITCDPLQQDFGSYNSSEWLQHLLTEVDGCKVFKMPEAETYRHPIIPQILANATKYEKHYSPTT